MAGTVAAAEGDEPDAPLVEPVEMGVRQQQLPKVVCDIAWRAQVRLCGRYRKLVARGKHPNTVAAAIARELAGFMWAIARAQGSAA